jgi:hypothetical protein
MVKLNPLMIVVVVATGIFLIGVFVAWIQARIRTRGYTEIAADVKAIAKVLKGDIFRDGLDLVISGRANKFPTVVRFSRGENTPALNILMHAPCNFSLFLSPRNRPGEGGRTAVRLPSELDAPFQARADHPVEARAFLAGETQMAHLGRLIRPSDGFLTFSRAKVEFSQLSLPSQGVGAVVIGHLASLSALAKVAGTMPGASTVKIEDRHERRIFLKLAIAALILLGITVVVGAVDRQETAPAVHQTSKLPAYPPLPPADAAHIRGADDWHIAGPNEFDATALANVRGEHAGPFPGRVSVEIEGPDHPAGIAYALVSNSDSKRWRLVVNSADGQTVVDSLTGPMSLIAAVPRQNLGAIQWNEPVAAPADGDGIMVVYKKGDSFKSTVIYFSGKHLRTGLTDSYDTVAIR